MKKLLLLLVLTCYVGTASATDYYVTGVSGITNQTEGEWDAAYEGNKMEDIGDGKYRLVVTGKSLTGGTGYQYKITDGQFGDGHDWGWSGNNAYFTPQISGTYNITYIFDATNKDVYEAEALLIDGPDIYLHSSLWWADNDDYKFSKTDGIYTLEADVSSQTDVFYFRFKINGYDKDCGASTNGYSISTGIQKDYNIILNDGNYYGEKNFTLPLNTKPLAKIKLTLKFINRKLVMDLQSYEKVTTNASGYATFTNNYPLTITDASAYYATDNNDGSATAISITNPAASTPMIIKGVESTTYYFAVAETGTDYSSTNAFHAGSGSALGANDGGGYNYILKGDAFYLANGNTVATNKAYLKLSEAATAKALIFMEDEETDGIKAVQNSVIKGNGEVYNLAGQRVAKDYKGIVIKNGKKYMNK